MDSNTRLARAASLVVFTVLFSWLLLGVFRTSIIEPQTALKAFLGAVPAGIASSYLDLVFLASLAAIAVLSLIAARASRVATRAVLALFYVIVAVCICWGFANINLVKILGEPFTFQWLVYGDFLQNEDARNAMGDAFNLHDCAIIVASVLVALVLGQVTAPDQEKKYKSLSSDLQTLGHFLD